MISLVITKAAVYGFYVYSTPSPRGSWEEIKFTGTLDECLAFIRREFAAQAITIKDPNPRNEPGKPGYDPEGVGEYRG